MTVGEMIFKVLDTAVKRYPKQTTALGLVMLVLLGSTSLSLRAQSIPFEIHPAFRVQHWTVADGLPVNNVKDILQTNDGYLWIATFDGLVRFDGLRFVVFNASNSPGLTTNRIIELYESPDGELWLTTENNKVVRYANEHFTTFDEVDGRPLVAQQDRTFYTDGDTLWVKSRTGLFRYHAGRFTSYRPELLDGGLGLVRDMAGMLWVAAAEGVVHGFARDGSVQRYSLANDAQGAIYHLFVDRQQRLWAATAHGPQVLHDGRFVTLGQTGGAEAVAAEAVFYLGEDKQGRVWGHNDYGWWSYQAGDFSYLDGGIRNEGWALYTQQLGPEGDYWRFQGDALYQGTERILTQARGQVSIFYVDAEGRLWVGGPSGLFMMQRNVVIQTLSTAQGLPWNNVYPMVEDRDGHVWIGTWNPKQPTFARTDGTRITAYREGPGFPTALYMDRQGTLWMGTDGLYRWEGTRFEAHLPGLENIFIRNIRAIYEDSEARFWVAEGDTLWLGQIDSSPDSWLPFSTGDQLPHAAIRAILETRSGEILFGTNGGGILRLIEPPPARISPQQADYAFEDLTTRHGLASNQVRDLYEDASGILWVATEDRGLCRLDRQGQPTLQAGHLVCIDADDGLFDNSLHRIIADDYGRFWFNTNQGVFWVEQADLNAFATEGGSVLSVSYTERDGLVNREGNGGIQAAGFKASDGKIWFPSQGGVVIIDPVRVVAPQAPPVVIEQVETEAARYGGHAPLVLPAGVRDFDIRYTALAFSRPEAVRFRYRLEGYDEGWHEVGDRRTATYTNLGPGTYMFEVRAGLGGVWSEQAATLVIERVPYVWETWWFIAFNIVLLGVALGGLYRYRVHQVEMRNKALEAAIIRRTSEIRRQKDQIKAQADELLQANVMKSRFLTNISHEFRTPLTLTFGPIDDWLEGRLGSSEEARPHFERARRNGQRLLRLINQLLDLARLDAEMLALNLATYDLVAFIRQRVAAFQSLAAKRQIDLQFLSETKELLHSFDGEKMEIVVLNLLSNAFKFTPAGGMIGVGLHREGEHIVLVVRDSGMGIAAAHVPHLFDRFYQVDVSRTRAHEGSGIGLALCKELVELHQGTIAVESTVGRGSTFVVTLPLSNKVELMEDEGFPMSIAEERGATNLAVASYIPEVGEEGADIEARVVSAQEEAAVVLIVDDNADMRAYMRFHLSPHFVVEEASNGKAGLEQAFALVPDLVLSDVMMPEMDGFALLEALRHDVRTSHIPVVLLTAKADAESKLAGLHRGADDYLAKPFSAAELIARLENLIAVRQQLRRMFGQRMFAGDEVGHAFSSIDYVFLGRVREVIQERLSDPTFGVRDLAEAVGMSRRQLSRKMLGVSDTSASTLIRQMRLERAAAMLAAKSGSVKEVGYAVGFRSPSRFREAFREIYGVAPSAYAANRT